MLLERMKNHILGKNVVNVGKQQIIMHYIVESDAVAVHMHEMIVVQVVLLHVVLIVMLQSVQIVVSTNC